MNNKQKSKKLIDWSTFCGALRGFIRESDTKNVDKLVNVGRDFLNDSQISWVEREIIEDGEFECYGKENPFNDEFVDSVFSDDHPKVEYTDDFKWAVHISALKYYAGRMTIASATYPSDFLSAYGNHFTNAQKDDVYNYLSQFIERHNGCGNSGIDLPIWYKFLKFCDYQSYENVTLMDGSKEDVFFVCGRYYTVKDFSSDSYIERYLPMQNVTQGESKRSAKTTANVCQSKHIMSALVENGLEDLIPETERYWNEKNSKYTLVSKKTDLPAFSEDDLFNILSNVERFGIDKEFVPFVEYVNDSYYCARFVKPGKENSYNLEDRVFLPFRNDGTAFESPKDAYVELLFCAIANIKFGRKYA